MATGHYLKKKKFHVSICKILSGECCKSFGLISAQESLLNTYGFANWLEGKPGISDEPQHNVMGKITKKILNLLDIKNTTLRNDKDFKI